MKKLVVILCLLGSLGVNAAQQRHRRTPSLWQRIRRTGEQRYIMAVVDRQNKAVLVYRVADDGSLAQVVAELPFGVGENPNSVSFNRTGTLLAVANFHDNNVSVFRVAIDGSLTLVGAPFGVGRDPSSVAFNPDGTLLVVANSRDNTVTVLSVADDGSLTPVGIPFGVGVSPQSVAFNSDGTLIAVANSISNHVNVLTVADDGSLTEMDRSPIGVGIRSLSVSFKPTGSILASVNFDDETVSVLSRVEDGSFTQVLGSPYLTVRSPNALLFSPIDQLLVVAGRDGVGTFTINEDNSLNAISLVEVPLGSKSISFSPDGKLLAVVNEGIVNVKPSITIFAVSDEGKLNKRKTKTLARQGLTGVAFTWYQPYLQKIQEAIEETTGFPTPVAELVMELAGESAQMPFNLDIEIQKVEKQGITGEKEKYLEVFNRLLRHLIKYKFNQMAQLALNDWIKVVLGLDDAKDIIQKATAIVTQRATGDKADQEILGAIIQTLVGALDR